MSMKVRKKLVAQTLEDLIKRDGAKCERCGRNTMLTIDHIIPEMILKQMGFSLEEMYYHVDNLRILCRPCNQMKSYSLDFSTPKTKELLIRYLQRL